MKHISRLILALLATAFVATVASTAAAAVASNGGGAIVIAPNDTDPGKYELDMDKMRRYVKASKALMDAAQKDPALGEALESSGDETPKQMIDRMARNARVKAILVGAGTTPADYVLTTHAYAVAAAVGVMLQSSSNTRVPAEANRKNVDFFVKNRADIEKMMKEMGLMPPN